MVSTTNQAEAITRHTSHVALWCSVSAGLFAAFLAGILLATSLSGYGIGLTTTGWDLARGGAILFTMVATLAGLIWWGVEQVVTRLGDQVGQQQPEQIKAMIDAAVKEAYAQGAVDTLLKLRHDSRPALRPVD